MGRTAAELTEKEKREYREGFLLQEEAEGKALLSMRERAWKTARVAARVLKEEFQATRVILFGSLSTGSRFHVRSDVDLAVAGLQPESFWRADCRLECIGDGLEIDLVDLGTVSPGLADSIRRDGVDL